MTPSVTITESIALGERLKRVALRTFSTLIALSRSDSREATEMQDKFYSAVCDITDVRIEPLPESAGTFYVEDGVLHVSERPVAQILIAASSEFERRCGSNDAVVEASELPKLLECIFVDFILHELRHRTQGIGDFDVVQRLKAAAGRSVLAEIDAYADRDAAWAYASVEAGWHNRNAFLEKFREALFFSGDYYFKAFPISSNRHDKVERAIAVLLMAARLAKIDFSVKFAERIDLPLDAALSVSLASPRTALAIYRAEPSKRLLGVANDTDSVAELVNDVNAGRFDAALQRSFGIVGRLNLLS